MAVLITFPSADQRESRRRGSRMSVDLEGICVANLRAGMELSNLALGLTTVTLLASLTLSRITTSYWRTVFSSLSAS